MRLLYALAHLRTFCAFPFHKIYGFLGYLTRSATLQKLSELQACNCKLKVQFERALSKYVKKVQIYKTKVQKI